MRPGGAESGEENVTGLKVLQRGDLESSAEREGRCMGYTRRRTLAAMGITGLWALVPSLVKNAMAFSRMQPLASGARACQPAAVINDEIGQDFEKACQIVSVDFGLDWIELRSMWNKNVTELDTKVDDARKILAAHKLQVTDIASPLFKTDGPEPRVTQSETRDQLHADFDASAQDKLLDRCICPAKTFETDRIRCFDFWRLDDQAPYRAAINAKLQQAAQRCAKENIILFLKTKCPATPQPAKRRPQCCKRSPTRISC